MSREIPLHTIDGVQNADILTHHFNTDDGLGLSILRFNRAPSDDIMPIEHGAITSTDMS